jgi:hypothetical protein
MFTKVDPLVDLSQRVLDPPEPRQATPEVDGGPNGNATQEDVLNLETHVPKIECCGNSEGEIRNRRI